MAPAATKAEELYLLTTKLFCGNCGSLMAGESGKSCTGHKYRYYKCSSAKRKKGCTKKAVKKEWIEDLVIEQTMKLVFDDRLMKRIADTLMEIQGEESPDVRILEKQLAEVNKGIDNVLNAIQAGIVTASTKQRLEELEARRTEAENAIAQARIESPMLSREQIDFFLNQFRDTNIADERERQRLIDCFINAVYVYDDKIVLVFNYRNGTKTVSLEEVNSSDFEMLSPPKNKGPNRASCFLSIFRLVWNRKTVSVL